MAFFRTLTLQAERKKVMKKGRLMRRRGISLALSAAMVVTTLSVIPASKAEAAPSSDEISNDSLTVSIGDLGQISSLKINNNRLNSEGNNVNFVLPNDSENQNNEAHQWMGEMIFSYRTSEDGTFPKGREGFVEVDTNKTLAKGGSTTYSNASENLEDNPYIDKKVEDDRVEVTFHGEDLDSTTDRTMKGFDVQSVYDMDTDDGSMLWSITLKNTSDEYIEFGDVGLPMPWNNKYGGTWDNRANTYNNRMSVHTYAGADSGYAYAIRTSGEGNYILFTPVPETGARIEYIDQWHGNVNGIRGTRSGSLYQNWTSDTGDWYPGLQVYYIHSKDIQKTGRGYFTDATSLVLKPDEEKTYQFKFSAVRAGDNTPQDSSEDHNNASDSIEEREKNQRSILYDSGMIDAVAVPSFQTAINMPTKLDLHYDPDKISDVYVDVQCVHENDPWDEEHIPEQQPGLVNNNKAIEHVDMAHEDEVKHISDKEVDGEWHHIYELNFGCIGNNSVRVNYKLKGEDKFTQFEFNVLEKLDETIEAHSDFMVENTQDNDPNSETYGIYSDWYISSGKDPNQKDHWADDWSHDNIDFMTMKNYLDPEAEEVESIERYLIDFMWDRYMKNSQESFIIADWLKDSSIYGGGAGPYSRDFAEMMVCTGFFNMYRLEKAYPDLIEYRQPAEWYLDKAFNIYNKTIDAGTTGFYGEQQVPQMIEALRDEGMTDEADTLQEKFAKTKGTRMATATYPYGSEFECDNTGEEGAYAAAKALRTYYPDDANAEAALSNMEKAEWKTRAMRGIQPTWYHYADPVFRGGETWWNFQYTASLAGSIMDDWLRYEDNGWDTDSSAWAQRLNYAAKISNFNAVNMGQISDKSIGATSWRYTMSKGGVGAQNVYDGGTRIMNNGWNDFSGESEEGLYGSLLRISADVATDPVFGLTGYGAAVEKDGSRYIVTPLDGIGKRINIIDNKIYVELEQDPCTTAVIDENGSYINLSINNTTGEEHLSKITLSGAGLEDGFYSVKVNGKEDEQCFVSGNAGVAYAVIPEGESAEVTIEKMDGGDNQAPKVYKVKTPDELQAMVEFRIEGLAYDDGAPDGTLSYDWEVTEAPEGGTLTIDCGDKYYGTAQATLEGNYTVQLTVSDGEKTTVKEEVLEIGRAPEKKAPVIDEVSAVQHPVNTTVAELSASATSDATYGNDLDYEWTVVDQPEGGNAIIGNAEQKDALLKAYVPGTYTVRLTVTDRKVADYDEDISVSKDVEVEMSGQVDGVERGGIVITQVGEAPELPETLEVIHPDGRVRDSRIIWDEIAETNYAETGRFTVGGTVEDTELRVEMTVIVADNEGTNVAFVAEPSAIINTPSDLGGVAALNDGIEPANSGDKSHWVWHNWKGEQSADAWVQYDWTSPVVIYQSNAYYFRDEAGNFQPDEVWYEYKDANGMWRPLPNVNGCGTELNKFNVTTFDPIETTAIRMYMSPKTLGCGVHEWQILGFADGVVDKNALRQVISSAEDLNLSLFDMDEAAEAEFEAALNEANAVYKDSEATQTEVDMAAAKLARIIATLPTADGNLAYSASVSTSFVSGHENLSAVNDGKVPEDSFDPRGMNRYGSWGNTSAYETVTYTWNSEVTLNKADMYFWYDGGKRGDYTAGGIQIPKEYYYEYLDSEGNWQPLENVSSYEIAMDKFNTVTFDEVTTTSIRVTMVKQEADGNGVGIMEWKVYGKLQPADKEALNAAIASAEEKDEADYTEESWAAVTAALENAKSIAANEKASQTEVNLVLDALTEALENLEEKQSDSNIAPLATPSGICNYDGQDGRPYDQGGLPKMQDQIDPANSSDLSNGTWLNWNDRYTDNVTDYDHVQNAWVAYTWDKPMILESTDVYYFTDGGGHQMPESVTFEYLNDAGEWVEITGVTPGCAADQYNTTELGNICTTALRMTMVPQLQNNKGPEDSDPICGVGVIEWKVNGYAVPEEEVDKTELEAAIAEAEKLSEDDYTADSWKDFAEALEEAKAVAENDGATLKDVEDALSQLEIAVKALVEKESINKDALNAAIEEAEKRVEEEYAPEDWATFERILNYAKEVAENENADQQTVDETTALLNMVIKALDESKPEPSPDVDREALEALIKEAEGYIRTDYTAESWAVFTEALMDAYKADYNADATQDDVDSAADALEKAIAGLEAVHTGVDLTEIRALINQALDITNEGYTAESWDALQTALVNAAMATNDPDVTQEQIDQLAAALKDAIAALEEAGPVADCDAINALIEVVQKLNKDSYTADSWTALEKALADAKAAAGNSEATQAEIDKAAKALIDAIAALEVAKPAETVEFGALNALIDVAEMLNKDNYTAESWNALQDALAAALAAAEDPEATQDQIDELAAALGDAIAALEIARPDEDPGQNPDGKPDGNTGSGSDKDPNGNAGSGADGDQNTGTAVQTGDNSPIMAYGMLAVITAAGIVCIAGMRRRRR